MGLGQKLEDARNRKGISIREATESTKIRSDYLSSFEAGDFNINLPGCSQSRKDPDCWEEVPGRFISDMDV